MEINAHRCTQHRIQHKIINLERKIGLGVQCTAFKLGEPGLKCCSEQQQDYRYNLEVYRTDATLSLASYLSLAVYASFA